MTAGVAGAAAAQVLGIVHRRVERPLAGASASTSGRIDWLVDEACRQAAQVRATAAGDWLHLVCTTCLSIMVTGWAENARRLLAPLGAVGLLQQYQCTGWGYALRFAQSRTRAPRLLLSIVDADIHDVVATGFEDAIGQIGYGVTTVGLALDAGRGVAPRCGGPFANKGFNELLRAIRDIHRQHGRTLTFMPFLADGLRQVGERLIGADTLAPNHYARYAHAFGGDPWIGLAEWQLASPPPASTAVTLGAFAYDGYFTACNVAIGPSALVSLVDAPAPREEPR